MGQNYAAGKALFDRLSGRLAGLPGVPSWDDLADDEKAHFEEYAPLHEEPAAESKPWGQVSYEGYLASVTDEVADLLPTWSEMSDPVQARWEEHARMITTAVGEKYFPGDEKTQEKAFDLGQGNLDIAEHYLED